MMDTSGNGNTHLDAVYVGAGGGANVSNVAVNTNTFRLRPNYNGVGIYGATNVTQSGNTTVRIA
jgi:threonine dehydratase